MSDSEKLVLGREERPEWLHSPQGFIWMVGQGLVRFGQWELLSGSESLQFSERLCARYGRDYFAVAWRAGSDDIACLENGSGETVKVINGYTDPGRQVQDTFGSFWDWFRQAIEDMIDYADGDVIDEK